MKRLFIVASLAIMAVACQKTEVQNLVTNEIGFNTEIGKQTRAINNTSAAVDNFGVFSFLHDTESDEVSIVMNNQEVTTAGVTVDKTYYWPNDPDNYINFYAYSPFRIPVVLSDDDDAVEGTMTLEGYNHTDYYTDAAANPKKDAIDFMVADDVTNAQFGTTYVSGQSSSTYGVSVPIVFHHEMTQVQFNVSATATEGVTFKLISITFDNAVQKANFNNENQPKWTPAIDGVVDVNAYPLTVAEKASNSNLIGNNGITTTALTMIPLTPESITVEYQVIANSVTETVNETMTLTNSVPWAANKKITYNLSIGLHTISFKPSVADWSENQYVTFVPDAPATPAN